MDTMDIQLDKFHQWLGELKLGHTEQQENGASCTIDNDDDYLACSDLVTGCFSEILKEGEREEGKADQLKLVANVISLLECHCSSVAGGQPSPHFYPASGPIMLSLNITHQLLALNDRVPPVFERLPSSAVTGLLMASLQLLEKVDLTALSNIAPNRESRRPVSAVQLATKLCETALVLSMTNMKAMITIRKNIIKFLTHCDLSEHKDFHIEVIYQGLCTKALLPTESLPEPENKAAVLRFVKVMEFQLKFLIKIRELFSRRLRTTAPAPLWSLLYQAARYVSTPAVFPSDCTSAEPVGALMEQVRRLVGVLLPHPSAESSYVEAAQEQLAGSTGCFSGLNVLLVILESLTALSTSDENAIVWTSAKFLEIIAGTIGQNFSLWNSERLPPVYKSETRRASVHTWTVSSLVGYLDTFTPACFLMAEQWLLRCLLSPFPHLGLVAKDTWLMLLKRIGDHQLCHSHCLFLIDLICGCEPASAPNGSHTRCNDGEGMNPVLLARCSHLLTLLVQLLPRNLQESTFNHCSPAQLLRLYVPIHAFNKMDVTKSATAVFTSICDGMVGRGEKEEGKSSIVHTLDSLTAVYAFLPKGQQDRVELWMLSLWKAVQSSTKPNPGVTLSMISLLCRFGPQRLDFTLKVFTELLSSTSEASESTSRNIVLARFLKSLGPANLRLMNPNQVVNSLTQCFKWLLRTSHGFSKLVALDAFKRFSETTSLTEVIVKTTNADPNIQEMVVSFMSESAGGPIPLGTLTELEKKLDEISPGIPRYQKDRVPSTGGIGDLRSYSEAEDAVMKSAKETLSLLKATQIKILGQADRNLLSDLACTAAALLQ